MFPVYEASIAWENGRGRVEEPRFYLPATSIKGTLRHRTQFYTRVLCQEWIGSEETLRPSATELVNQLFGTKEDEQGIPIPGAVYVSEPVFSKSTTFRVMQHVALDRFTQGPLRSALFGEVLLELADQPFELSVVIDWNLLNHPVNDNDSKVRKAFELALEDLVNGRLSLGAAGSRGHGKFEGQWTAHTMETGA